MFKFDFKGLSEENVNVFLDMIPYVSPKIIGVTKNEHDVIVNCEEQYNENILEELIRLIDLIKTMKDSNLEVITLEDFTKNSILNTKNVFPELVKNNIVRELTSGVFSYSGIFLRLYEYFDRKINEYAYENFDNLIEEVYPVLFPIDEYIKGRYFEKFPHYMMFQTKLNNDIDTYKKFISNKSTCTCMNEILDDISLPKNVLRHATCAPVYPYLENYVLKEDEVKSFLVSGRCFRNEELNIKEMSRLNEFNMKEFVFVGGEDELNALIDKSKNLVRFWIDTFSLNSKCETANDSFFASNYKKLRYFQLIGNSKLEYKVLIPSNKEYISCCSANYHRTHFSKPYNIRTYSGEYCYTACFAFGIERLVYALLSQKGLDITKWDDDTIYEIDKYVKL